jgi:hypothetical protein
MFLSNEKEVYNLCLIIVGIDKHIYFSLKEHEFVLTMFATLMIYIQLYMTRGSQINGLVKENSTMSDQKRIRRKEKKNSNIWT